MQGKEASEQAAASKSSAGIDVSKDWLDVHVLPSGERMRVANDPAGIKRLKRWLGRFTIGLVAIEATGKWHRPVWRSLHASALAVAVVDPYRARQFAGTIGILAKTDRLDARVLAGFAATIAPHTRPPPPRALEELAELLAGREAAVEEQTGLKNQRASATVAVFRRQLVTRLARLAKDIAALEREILARIAAEPALARRYQILTSIPSIGPIVAATLIARLAELGTLPDKQIAMLSGLAPIADQSGHREGKRVIWGGRASVRRMLYLAAVAALRWNPQMEAFYRRLREAGKPAKVALIAVARKLALLANTLIANDRTWKPLAP